MGKQCPNCGKELKNNAKFCSKCGAELNEEIGKSLETIDSKEIHSKSKTNKFIIGIVCICIVILCFIFVNTFLHFYFINIYNRCSKRYFQYFYTADRTKYLNAVIANKKRTNLS